MVEELNLTNACPISFNIDIYGWNNPFQIRIVVLSMATNKKSVKYHIKKNQNTANAKIMETFEKKNENADIDTEARRR